MLRARKHDNLFVYIHTCIVDLKINRQLLLSNHAIGIKLHLQNLHPAEIFKLLKGEFATALSYGSTLLEIPPYFRT